MMEFSSIEAFIAHLAKVTLAVKVAEHQILEKVGVIVEARAKEKMGTYQEQTGPFIAWPDLAESTKSDRVRQGYPEDEPLLRSGETRDSISHTVSGSEVQIGSNSDIMVYQELGTKHIPPRSTLGGAMADKLPEIKEMTGGVIFAALIGEEVVGKRLNIEGQYV